MAVKNQYKAGLLKSVPKRKYGLGLPPGHELPQEPQGNRGRRRANKNCSETEREQYLKNKKSRASQKAPADRARTPRPGPSKRAPGTSREQWIALCTGGK